jgi:hypothetical protein
MAIQINNYSMSLAIGDRIAATASGSTKTSWLWPLAGATRTANRRGRVEATHALLG